MFGRRQFMCAFPGLFLTPFLLREVKAPKQDSPKKGTFRYKLTSASLRVLSMKGFFIDLLHRDGTLRPVRVQEMTVQCKSPAYRKLVWVRAPLDQISIDDIPNPLVWQEYCTGPRRGKKAERVTIEYTRRCVRKTLYDYYKVVRIPVTASSLPPVSSLPPDWK